MQMLKITLLSLFSIFYIFSTKFELENLKTPHQEKIFPTKNEKKLSGEFSLESEQKVFANEEFEFFLKIENKNPENKKKGMLIFNKLENKNK